MLKTNFTRKIVMVLAAAGLSASSVFALDPFEFTAASLNVDGLPQTFAGVPVNTDGPGSDGSKKISQAIAKRNWAFVGFSEDFNYHDEVTSALTDLYNISTHRATIGLNAIGTVDTDGLCFLTRKPYTFSGERWTMWKDRVGDLQNGADEKIKKGFRYYLVDFGNGYQIDVYITHMNSESSMVAVEAKHGEMAQFVEEILKTAHENNRPIIVMGDTNCRYTREELEKRFIDEINADPDLYIKDPWVELERNGFYPKCYFPTLDQGTLGVWQYGMQKGEVVDKIFYINHRQSGLKLTATRYFHDEDFSDEDGNALSDHWPVTADFTIEPCVYDMSEPLGPPVIPPGEFDGLTFYWRNVGTGKYFSQGRNWGTQAILDDVGFPITFTTIAGGYKVMTPCGAINYNDFYIDKSEAEYIGNPWTVARAGQYYTLCPYPGTLFGVANTATGLLNKEAKPEDPELFMWEFVTEEQRITELADATVITPIDATFLIKGAKFHRAEPDLPDYWPITKSDSKYERLFSGCNGAGEKDNQFLKIYNKKKSGWGSWPSSGTIKRTVSDLPAGKYTLSCQAFSNTTGNFHIKVNGTEKNELAAPSSLGSNIDGPDAAVELAKSDYTLTWDLELGENGEITIEIIKDSNSSETTSCVDDFTLMYYGNSSDLTALRNAYNAMLAEASELVPEKMNNAVKSALQTAMVPCDDFTTEAEFVTAADALRPAMATAKESIKVYLLSKEYINNMYKLMESTNVYTAEAYAAYKALADDAKARYNAGTLEVAPQDPFEVTGWHATRDCADFLYSAFGTHSFDNPMYINTWSVEGNNDGTGFTVPFFEYFANGAPVAGNTFTTTVSGLTPGILYSVNTWARVERIGDDTPTGITLQAGDGEPVDLCGGTRIGEGDMFIGEFAAVGTPDASGNLTIKFAIDPSTNIHWLAFKNLMCVEEAMIVGDFTLHNGIDYTDELDENEIAKDADSNWAAAQVTLRDHLDYELPVDVKSNKTVYQRLISGTLRGENGWHALYLPFEITDWSEFASTVIEFVDVEEHESEGEYVANMLFAEVPSGTALKSHGIYFFRTDDDLAIEKTISHFVSAALEENTTITHESDHFTFSLTGIYKEKTDMKTSGAYALSGNQFMKAKSDDVHLKPYRAFLTISNKSAAKAPQRVGIVVDHGDGITSATADDAEEVYYNLQGQRVENPTVGFYVRKGHKVYKK